MSRYIDADKIPYVLSENGCLDDIAYRYDINEVPTADVVEVVRCRDCKHLYCLSAIDRRFYCRHHPHGLEGINIIEDNPYCSYGERREE